MSQKHIFLFIKSINRQGCTLSLKNRIFRRKDGKVKIHEGLKINDSLKAVKYGVDGEIDLNTVDGLVRSMALAVTELHDREELKKACSLAEIQNFYFKIIEANFSHFYDLMKKNKLTPHTVALSVSENAQAVIEVTAKLKEFLDYLKDFWNELIHFELAV